jgi:hypothetical protein
MHNYRQWEWSNALRFKIALHFSTKFADGGCVVHKAIIRFGIIPHIEFVVEVTLTVAGITTS